MNTIPTSASDRYEAARRALAAFDSETERQVFSPHDYPTAEAFAVADALRTFIEPPATAETVDEIVDRHVDLYANEAYRGDEIQVVRGVIEDAVRAGIQAAWDTWEPEAAPTNSDDRVYTVGERDDTPDTGPQCGDEHGDWICTRAPGHGGNHAAGTGDDIGKVWD